MEAWWGVVVGVLLGADFRKSFLEVFDVVGKPHVNLIFHLGCNSNLISSLVLNDFQKFSVVL